MSLRFPSALRVIGRSFTDWWDSWLDLVGVVLLWFVAQFTIILGPPATLGLYYVAHSLVNGESLGARGLLEGGRRYFWKSWLWALLNLLFFAALSVNFRFYGSFSGEWAFYIQIVLALIGWTWVVVQIFALPYMVEIPTLNLFRALRNGLFTGLASPVFSFILFLFTVIALALSLGLVLPLLFGLPILVPLAGVRALYDRLETYGLKARDKSPKELERDETSHIRTTGGDDGEENRS